MGFDQIPVTLSRRKVLWYGGVAGVGATYGLSGTVLADDETEVDDRGDPISDSDDESGSMAMTTTSQPDELPDGEIVAADYQWLDEGAPQLQSDTSLRLTDDGGVDPRFQPSTPDDLTISTYWRHNSGGSLAYLFNDQDSISSGFRAFTNGIAGNGLYFRNVFGGGDIYVSGNFQDGRWYHVQVVLDASENTYSVYVDGNRVARSFYDGNGFSARSRFRLMGRASGSSTTIDYDRYVVTAEAIEPAASPTRSNVLVHYELDEGSGTVLTNAVAAGPQTREKRRLIREIRDTAAPLLPVSRSRIDSNADGFISRVEEEYDDSSRETRRQYDIGVDRLTKAEHLTEKVTSYGADVLELSARAAVLTAFPLALGKAVRSGWSTGNRIVDDHLRGLRRTLREARESVLGLSGTSTSIRRQIAEFFDSTMADEVADFLESNRGTIESLGSTAVGDGIARGVETIGVELLDRFTDVIDRLTETLTKILYTSYYLRSTFFPVGQTPVLEECGFQLDVSPGDVRQGRSINGVAEDRARRTEAAVDENGLTDRHDGRLDEVERTVVPCYEGVGDDAVGLLERLESIAEIGDILAILLVIGAGISWLLAAASAFEIFSSLATGALGGFFMQAAGLVIIFTTTVRLASVGTGWNFARFSRSIHSLYTENVVAMEEYR